MQIWKGSETAEGENCMVVDGSSMNSEAILEAFATVKNDKSYTELDTRGIDFEHEECLAFVEAIRSRRRWKSVKISNCGGQVNDVVIPTMSQNNIVSFSLDSMVNSQTIYGISLGLKYSPNLSSLSLSVPLTGDHANLLARAIVHSKLKDLSLSGSTIEEAAISPLGFALRLNQTLECLTLDGCNLEDTQTSHLLVAMQNHPTLTKLSLQQNACHDQGMPAIAALLHLNQLVELDLSYLIRQKKVPKPDTSESASGSDEAVPEDEEEGNEEETDKRNEDEKKDDESKENKNDEAKENSTTQEAEIKDKDKKPAADDSGSDDDDSRRVRNTSLVTLQLAGNNLTDSYVSGLLSIFGKDSGLKELNLFGNRLTDDGVEAILRRLRDLKRLKALWLSFNNITSIGARKVAEAMKTNYSLEDVKIKTMTMNESGSEDDDIEECQLLIDHYARLNQCGRYVVQEDRRSIPLSLYPHILERCTRIMGKSTSYEADAFFCFVRGPMLFEKSSLPTPRKVEYESPQLLAPAANSSALTVCSACNKGHPKSAFSKAQLKKPASARKCKSCVDKSSS